MLHFASFFSWIFVTEMVSDVQISQGYKGKNFLMNTACWLHLADCVAQLLAELQVHNHIHFLFINILINAKIWTITKV